LLKIVKKFKPNTITVVDIILIILVFFGLRMYYNKEMPIKKTIKKNGIQYTVFFNKYTLKEDEFLIINFAIKNNKRKKQILNIEYEDIFNFVISKEDKLIYKKNYMDNRREISKKIELSSYKTVFISEEWFLTSNTDNKIKDGKYHIKIYSKDLDLVFDMDFELAKKEKELANDKEKKK